MSVVSYIFIVFLAVTVLIYYIVPKKIQWWVLLAASVVFYAYSGIDDFLIVVGTAFLVYPLTMLMEKNLEEQDRLLLDADKRTARKIKTAQKKKRKKYLVLALLIVIGALIVFKVTGFAIENIKRFLPYEAIQRIPDWHFPAPLGVSFYSFMMISYLVDVYNGRIHAQKNFLKYLSYVLYFPHITQGPIARYELVAHQLWEKHKFDYDTVIKGTWLILWGALKKMVMADRISPFVTEVFKHSDQYEGMIFFLAAVMYSIQIYCDFSGCMDIVRGASECFGITLGENFRRPYFSQTLPEFWRRWHITLGTWMKDYIFYPMSLSKKMNKFGKWGKKHFGNTFGRTLPICFANIVIFFIVGIWHGAAWKYIAYGLYNGFIIAISNLLEPVYKKLLSKFHINATSRGWTLWQIIRTFILVNIGWYFDMADSVSQALCMIRWSIQGLSFSQLNSSLLDLGIEARDYIIIIAGCIIVFIISVLKEKGIAIRESIAAKPLAVRWAAYYALIAVILIFGYIGATQGFIYANF